MSSTNGTISAFIGSKWHTIRLAIALAAVGGMAATGIMVTGGSGGGGGDTYHLFVATSSCDSTPTRQSTATTFAAANASAIACTFPQAVTAATSGDEINVRSGTHGPQGSVGSASKTTTFIGEDGAIVDVGTGSPNYSGFNFSGNTTVDNVDVTGEFPIVSFFGDSNTWQNFDYYPYPGEIRPYNANEPILLEDGESGQTTVDNPSGTVYRITNTTLRNGRVGVTNQFRGCRDGDAGNGCPDGDNMHLELARVSGGSSDTLFDNVQWGPCPNGPSGDGGYVGCGSGQVFITSCLNPLCGPAKDITIQNSLFMGPIVNYHMQASSILGTANLNHTHAYNTYAYAEPIAQGSNIAGVRWIGNYGNRPQNCTTGSTWTRNVWAWTSGSPCGTDQRVAALDLDGDFKPDAGSAAINGAETPDGSSYCVNTLTVDAFGVSRPFGASGNCDAGWAEVG